MEIHGFETVDSLPCLYHDEADLLVLSDLHLGLEGTMTSEGNYVPKHQLKRIKNDIERAKSISNASRILINGDLKNEFKTSYSESKEVEKLAEFLKKTFEEVIIVKGNHDTFIESSFDRFNIKLKEFYKESEILFIHGDRKLENFEVGEFETLVIGHEHPALGLKDDIGVKEKIDCFLYGKTKKDEKIIVLPAFSSISRGTNINETSERELLSPILKQRVEKDRLKALGVSREAGLFEFPEVGRI